MIMIFMPLNTVSQWNSRLPFLRGCGLLVSLFFLCSCDDASKSQPGGLAPDSTMGKLLSLSTEDQISYLDYEEDIYFESGGGSTGYMVMNRGLKQTISSKLSAEISNIIESHKFLGDAHQYVTAMTSSFTLWAKRVPPIPSDPNIDGIWKDGIDTIVLYSSNDIIVLLWFIRD